MAANRYLDRRGFATWLEESGDEVVGSARLSRQCPVASYLTHQTKRWWNVSPLACVPQVDAEPGEDPDNLRHEFKPPKWARTFIYALDSHFSEAQPITGNEALYVLREAVA